MEHAIFLRAERNADGTRTFKLIEGEPLETSYGEDLYRKVFGVETNEAKADNGSGSLADSESVAASAIHTVTELVLGTAARRDDQITSTSGQRESAKAVELSENDT
jgi:hypothetical protein